MKKIVSVVLSFVLLFSCLVFTNVNAMATTDSYSVTATVSEQDGLLGGALSCDATQSVAAGEEVTVSAVPFYGNGFIGWYDGDTPLSGELTYSFVPTADTAISARFDIKNLFENGDMEVVSAQSAVVDGINNAEIKHGDGYYGTASAVANSESGYGNYALKLTPDQTTGTTASVKVKNLANIPVTVKINTNYIVRFSYKFDVASFSNAAHCIYISLNGLENGKIPSRDSDHTIKWSYHSERSTLTALNESTWSWAGADGFDAQGAATDNNIKNNSIAYYITDTSVNANGVWQNVYLLFNPKEDASIFGGNETGTAYFNLGTNYNCTDFLYVDNMSISEAAANSISIVSAGENGSVIANNNRSGEDYYTYTTGYRGESTSFTNRDTTNIYYPTIYESFTAAADEGYELVGWFDENNTLVSKDSTAKLLMTGKKYTAYFAKDITSEGGGYLLDNGDGTYTAKAYYGNKFLGWYYAFDKETVVTDEPTVAKDGNAGLIARFTEDNLIFDGDFEQNNNTAQVYADYKDYSATYYSTFGVENIPSEITNSGVQFGSNALKITPNQGSSAEKRKSLLNIPVSLTKGNTYLWKFSYAVISSAEYNNSTDILYLSVDPAAANGAIPWNLWDKTTGDALVEGVTKYSYHIHGSGYAEDNAWLWGDYTSDGTTSYSTTSARSAVNKWLDIYVIFTAEADKTYYLTLGCADSATNSFVIDNMSLSLAKTGITPTTVTAGENGTVSSYGTYEPAYTVTGARGASTVGTTPYYQDMYVDYFAAADEGYVFDGWYSGDERVSTDSVLRAQYTSGESYNAVFTKEAGENKFNGYNLRLGGDISMGFNMTVADAPSDAYMSFRIDGASAPKKVALLEATLENDGTYTFYCPLTSVRMAQTVTAVLCDADGNQISDSTQKSVKEYATAMLSDEKYAKEHQIVKALLNYGAEAQKYFGKNTSVLANSELSAEDQTVSFAREDIIAENSYTVSGEESGIKFFGYDLILSSNTKLRLYFEVAEGAETAFTDGDGNPLEVEDYSGYKYVTIADIGATELDSMHTVKVGGLTVNACALSYANTVLGRSGDDIDGLLMALYAYSNAANAYVTVQ